MVAYKRGSAELRTLLYRFNPWWEGDLEKPFKGLIPRDRYFHLLLQTLSKREIVMLVGVRRVGKTSLLKLLIRKLLEEVEPRRIFYVSLDHYLLSGLSILELVEEYMSLLKLSADEKAFLFLDEVAEKEAFDLQLKNLYDLYDLKIFASSSSSVLLKELPHLIGRSRILEILPLSFNEYLTFKGIRLKRRNYHLLKTYFEDYLKEGGMPEYILMGEDEYLKSLLDDIIYRDVIARGKFRDERLVKDFLLLLLERTGKQFSLNKVAKILGISPDTVRRLLSTFERTFLFFHIRRCGKTTERVRNPVKIYIADLGLRNCVLGFRDKGGLFENLVFLRLRERYRDDICYVFRNGVELDFLAGGELLVEVKYEGKLSPRQEELLKEMQVRDKVIISSPEEYIKLFEEELFSV